jgi:hypothetical protein
MPTETSAATARAFSIQRRWPRFKLDLPLRIVVSKNDNPAVVSGRGTEISEGGMVVFAGTELKLGDVIFVEFTPPYAGKPLRVAATVRNRSGYNYGVEFRSETAEENQEIANFRLMLKSAAGLMLA